MKTNDIADWSTDYPLHSKLTDILLNILYPASCIFCGKELDFKKSVHICTQCRLSLPTRAGNRCIVCGNQLSAQFNNKLCCDCANNQPHFDKIVFPFVYKGIVREAIIRYKFKRHTEYAKTMSLLMLHELDGCSFDIIVPVPISKKRKRERKYNQSELIAQHLYNMTHIPLSKNNLIKIKDTLRQSTLTTKERKHNVLNAFGVNNNDAFAGKTVLLVDDITTTRSTLDECSKVLKAAGASSVVCLVFAATDNR